MAIEHISEVALKVRLSQEARRRLLAQAAQLGQALDDYASKLLEQAAAAGDVDAILAPLRKEFAASGATDEQLIDQINQARDEYHADRRKIG